MASIQAGPEAPLDLSGIWRRPIVERRAGRVRRLSDTEQMLKAAAKQVAKQAGDLIDDRRSREAARIQIYNALTPVLLELRDRHEAASLRMRRAWVASIAFSGVAVLVALLI